MRAAGAKRLRLLVGLGLGAMVALGIGGAAATVAGSRLGGGVHVRIDIRYSRYEPATFTVAAGVPVEIEIHNLDPIDHEWIVGDEATHERHRTGTEAHDASRPTEVSIEALSTVTTVVTFSEPGSLRYICHLPGHEAYGMVGVVTITP